MTPDPRFVFYSVKHREALAHLLYGIRERQGFIEITGEVGTGKSTLCRALVAVLDDKVKVAVVLNSGLSGLDLLRTILEEFDINVVANDKKTLLDSLNQFLIEQLRLGNNAVLIIDEAQNLSLEALEQVRMLSNIETETEKLLEIILLGQPELKEKLLLPELRQLNQRITVRYHIEPLTLKETEEYISYRLSIAGSSDKLVFTKNALKTIFKLTEGTPRLINVLAHHSLLVAYARRTHEITDAIVKKSHNDFNADNLPPRVTASAGVSFGRLLSSVTFGALLGALLFFLYSGSFFGGAGWSAKETFFAKAAYTGSKLKNLVYTSKDASRHSLSRQSNSRGSIPPVLLDKYLSSSIGKTIRSLGYEYVSDNTGGLTERDLEAMGVLPFRVNLAVSELEVLKRPFLIQVKGGAYKILSFPENDVFQLTSESGQKNLSKSEFISVYDGYVVMFRPTWLETVKELEGYSPSVRKLQEVLWELGFFTGVPGGFIGDKTREALRGLQKKNGLRATGALDCYTQMLLIGSPEREKSV